MPWMVFGEGHEYGGGVYAYSLRGLGQMKVRSSCDCSEIEKRRQERERQDHMFVSLIS